ncbi:hypothetical protein [Haliangium sp.]|uniref:hypothetical protein n=1 Tax=Haliangium sp. TaxID=2663208 RepID=UPI003D10A658
MKKMMMIAAGALLAVSLMACNSGPTCESIADHVMTVAKGEMQKMLEQLPEEQRKQMEEQMAKEFTKDKIVEECKKENPSKEAMECVMAAKTMEEMGKCDMKGKEDKAAEETKSEG